MLEEKIDYPMVSPLTEAREELYLMQAGLMAGRTTPRRSIDSLSTRPPSIGAFIDELTEAGATAYYLLIT